MAIYRGAGGAGDATNDATSQAIIASEAAVAAANSATEAAASAASASTSATNAANSATEAAGYALSINPEDLVHISGIETILGLKTFALNPILSGGTANGVAYLNGSKALTTSSSLYFDGTNLGIGRVPSAQLDVNGSANLRGVVSLGGSVELGSFGTGDRNATLDFHSDDTYTDYSFRIWSTPGANGDRRFYSRGTGGLSFINEEAGPYRWSISNTEQMRLTSTGLGIGTSSPSFKLDVNATGNILGRFKGSGTLSALYLADANTTTDTLYIGTVGNDFRVITNSSERVRIDSSGNLIQTVNTTPATLSANQTMTASIVNNSTLKFSVRGSDGVTRAATLVLV